MNNIWKYSLVLAFSIIIDQLVKGTAQSLIVNEGGVVSLLGPLNFVRIRNEELIFGLSLPFFNTYANTFAIVICTFLIFLCLRKIVHFRNRSPITGWAYTLLLTGLFTSWLDRVSQGFTLGYLGLSLGETTLVPFSIGDIYFFLGIISVVIFELRGRLS